MLLKQLLGHQQFINKVLGVKGFTVDLELIKIYVYIFKTISIQVVLLLHRDALILVGFQIFVSCFFLLNFYGVLLNEIRVFEHFDHFFEVGEPRINSESDWQLLVQSLLERLKLVIGLDDVFELNLVILVEFRRSNFVANQLVISILWFLSPGYSLILFFSLSLLFAFVLVNLFEPVTSETLLSLVLSLLSGCLATLGIWFLFHKLRL